jgi:hypothetical protein
MINRFSKLCISKHHQLNHDGLVRAFWKTSGAIALSFFALILPACNPSEGPEAGTTTSDVAQEVDADLIGKTVTISGEVGRVIGPNAFTVVSNEFLNNQAVLVVGAQGVSIPALKPNTVVRVTGTVRQLVVVEVEKEYGLDLSPELETELKDRPYIAASAVTVAVPGAAAP